MGDGGEEVWKKPAFVMRGGAKDTSGGSGGVLEEH